MVYAQFSKDRIVRRPGLLTACCHLYITASKKEAKSELQAHTVSIKYTSEMSGKGGIELPFEPFIINAD